MDLTHQLRDSIRDLHARIEALPLSRAMIEGRIGRDDYGRALTQLLIVHVTLEKELDRHPDLHVVYRPSMSRSAALRRDLAVIPAHWTSGRETLALVARIRDWSCRSPVSLLGSLYVLEGSRIGSMFLVKPLATALGVNVAPGQGLDYHLEGMAERPQAWQRFKASLLAAPLEAAQGDAIVAAAVATMEGLCDLYAALLPEAVAPVGTGVGKPYELAAVPVADVAAGA